MKQPLIIHILYQCENKEGMQLYSDLYKLLCRDYRKPYDSGIGIPVYFYTDVDGSIRNVDLSLGSKNFILLMVDQNMYLSETWRKYITEELLPLLNDKEKVNLASVSLYKYAYELNAKLGKYQFISFNH